MAFEPVDFLRRLAAIIPPPRQNLVRYHGIFAPHAKVRREVAKQAKAAQQKRLLPKAGEGKAEAAIPAGADDDRAISPRYRLLWADLLRRTFAIDILICPKCAGKMRLLSVIKDPTVIQKILSHLNLPTEMPGISPARPPPQLEFDDDWG